MKIVDRYILGKFFRIFFLCYIALVGVFVLLDLTSNLSDFLSAGPASKLLVSIPAYYFINSFLFVDLIFPLLILLAALTVTALMKKNNETIALLAMGVSPGRMLVPILVGAVGISFGFTAIRECYLPNRLVEITKSPYDFVKGADEINVCRSFDNKSQISIDGDRMIYSEGRIVHPAVTLGRNLNQFGNRIVASTGIYQEASEGRPAGWLLQDVSMPVELLKNSSLSDDELKETIVYSPADSSWLKENEVFVVTSLKPVHLAVGGIWLLYGSSKELCLSLQDPTFKRDSTSLAIKVHTRFLRPLGDLLPLLLGAPLVFLRNDKNIFSALGLGLLLAGSYVASQYVFAYIGEKMNLVALGVWAPFFIFIPIATNSFGKILEKNVGR